MSLGGKMVYLGKSKIDKTKRISLIKEIAELLGAEEGDYIEFYATRGKITIFKQTKGYDGFYFENEEIENRILQLEREIERKENEKHLKEMESDPEFIMMMEKSREIDKEMCEREETARKEYQKDKESKRRK